MGVATVGCFAKMAIKQHFHSSTELHTAQQPFKNVNRAFEVLNLAVALVSHFQSIQDANGLKYFQTIVTPRST